MFYKKLEKVFSWYKNHQLGDLISETEKCFEDLKHTEAGYVLRGRTHAEILSIERKKLANVKKLIRGRRFIEIPFMETLESATKGLGRPWYSLLHSRLVTGDGNGEGHKIHKI